jgi:hypothetical protein
VGHDGIWLLAELHVVVAEPVILELDIPQVPKFGSQLLGAQYSGVLPQYPLVLQQGPNSPPVQV